MVDCTGQQQQEEKELAHMREEALHAQFNMDKAIREGHITIVASQSMAEKEKKDAI